MEKSVLMLAVLIITAAAFSQPSYAKELSAISMDVTGDVESMLLASSKDYPTEILPYVQDIRTYTPQCFDCHLPILYKLTGDEKVMYAGDFSAYKSETIGKDTITSLKVAYLSNQTYQEWVSDMVCTDGKALANGTIPQTCEDKGSNVLRFRLVWSDSPAVLTVAGQQFYITDTYGQRKAELKGQVVSKVDIVPTVKGTALTKYAWWDAAWTYRANFTLKSSVTTDQILPRNFTLDTATLITAGKMKAACADLRLTNESDLEIPFYIESGCGTAKTIIWYKTTTDSDNSSLVWLYYGNADASDGQSKAGVMGTYVISYDMGEGTGTAIEDGSPIGNDGTITEGGWAAGMFGNATAYNGASSWAASAYTISSAESAFSMDGWVYTTNITDFGVIFGKGFTYSPEERQILFIRNANLIKAMVRNSTTEYFASSGELATGRWVHYATRWNGTYVDIFMNGTLKGSVGITNPSTYSTEFKIGRLGEGAYWFGGYVDNARYSFNTARSNDYIKMTYDTAINSALTTAIGTEQTGSTPAAATMTNLTINGAQANATHAYTPSTADNFTAYSNTTGLYVGIYINGVLKANTTTTATYSLVQGAGLYNITAITQANASFSQSNRTWWLNITKASNPTYFRLTLGNGTTFTEPFLGVVFNYSMSHTPKGYCTIGTCNLYYANCSTPPCNWISAAAQNNTAQLFGANNPTTYRWVYKVNSTGNDNYSSNTTVDDITQNLLWIKQMPSAINITFNTSASVVQGTPVLVTCNYPPQVSGNLYNDTGATTNPLVVNTASLLGAYNYTCNNTATANYTAGTYSKSLTVTLTAALIIDSVRDENNVSNTLTFDVEIYNATYSATSNGITSYNNNEVRGAVTVSISASGYGTRKYYISIEPDSAYNMTGYLLPIASGHNVQIVVKNAHENPVPGALLNYSRLYGSSWTLVEQGTTDNTGTYVFWLDGNANYQLDISASGYPTYTNFQNPALSAYTIYLTNSIVDLPTYWEAYGSFSGGCVLDNTTPKYVCSYSDSSGHLQNITLVVRKVSSSGEQFTCRNFSTSSNGTMTCILPTASNVTYAWGLSGLYASSPSWLSLATGSDVLLVAFKYGLIGVFMTLVITMVFGFISLQFGRASYVIFSTILALVFSMAVGFLTPSGTAFAAMAGLAIAGGVIMIKVDN